MEIPDYPREILPQKNWRENLPPFEILQRYADAMIGHMLEGGEEDCIDISLGDGFETIRIEALPLKRVPNLSCSLMGTLFITATSRNVTIYLKAWDDLKKNPNNKNQRIAETVGESRVNHAPTMLNYWHYTIDLYPAEEDKKPLTSMKKAWQESFAISLWDYLRHNFVIIHDDTQVPAINDTMLWTSSPVA